MPCILYEKSCPAQVREAWQANDHAMKILSPRIRHAAKEALDVRSIPELIRYC